MMKIIKSMLLTGLLLLMSAQTVFAAPPISMNAAEEIAAQYVPGECELLKSEQENNRFIFRFYNKNSQEWYKISLEKQEGKILTFDSCKTLNNGSGNVVMVPEEAQRIVGEEISDSEIVSCDLIESDGNYKYKVIFISGKLRGEYTLHPENGSILERRILLGTLSGSETDTELESTEAQTTASAVYIGSEKAAKAALKKAPGAEVISCELVYDEGRAVYKGGLKKDYFNYEFKVDAITGTMVEWNMENK